MIPSDVTISIPVLLIAVILLLIYLWTVTVDKNDTIKRHRDLRDKLKEQEYLNREQAITFKKTEADLVNKYQAWALVELDKFKEAELSRLTSQIEKNALERARVILQEWKVENEAKIRQDAITRSYSVNLGKITEHLVPFHPTFLSQFNPKDARFIGSPIDLIVFDGYADKRDNIVIYLVEIKTGNSRLNEIQKKIKQAVMNFEIRWAEINPDNPSMTEILSSSLKKQSNEQLNIKFNNQSTDGFL